MLKFKAIKLISSSLQSKDFMEKHKLSKSAFTRNRKLNFPDLMTLMIRKSIKSIQLVLNEFIDLTKKNFTVTSSAFSQARNKISYTAFEDINNQLIELYYKEKTDKIKTYKGYRVLGIDGCKITVPDNHETEKDFGWRKVGNNYGKNTGKCIRTTYECSYDVLNNIAVAGILGKGSVYEAHLAMDLCPTISTNDIAVFDRAYGSYELMAGLIQQNKHFVIRAQRHSFHEVQELYSIEESEYSEVVKLWPARKNISKISKSNLPNRIQVRLIKITLDNGEPEILITSLLDVDEFSISDFKEIYRLRWGVETFFGKLKGRLNIDHFSGKSLNVVKQDIWSTIMLSNLETIITEDIDEDLKELSRAKDTNLQRINKSISFHAIKSRAFDLFYSELDLNLILEELRNIFLVNREYVRSSRIVPRTETSGFKKWKYHKCIKKQVF